MRVRLMNRLIRKGNLKAATIIVWAVWFTIRIWYSNTSKWSRERWRKLAWRGSWSSTLGPGSLSFTSLATSYDFQGRRDCWLWYRQLWVMLWRSAAIYGSTTMRNGQVSTRCTRFQSGEGHFVLTYLLFSIIFLLL